MLFSVRADTPDISQAYKYRYFLVRCLPGKSRRGGIVGKKLPLKKLDPQTNPSKLAGEFATMRVLLVLNVFGEKGGREGTNHRPQ